MVLADTVLRPGELRDFLVEGNRWFASSDELCELLGVLPGSLHGSLHRPVERGEMANVCPRGWVPVPDHCRGEPCPMPPPTWYLDEMMRHMGHSYYVGYNAAAERWGAAHHRSLVVPVVTTARSSHRTARSLERSHPASADAAARIRYVHRDPAGRSVDERIWDVGCTHPPGTRVVYSSPEATLLDAAERPDLVMGPDNVCNIACGMLLWGHMTPAGLAAEALGYPIHARQRAGTIMDRAVEHTGIDFDLGPLRAAVPRHPKKTPLYKSVERWFPAAHAVPDPLPADRWGTLLNGLLDPDV